MKRQSADMLNLMIALVLSMLILSYWQYFVEAPRKKADAIAQQTKAHTALQIEKELDTVTLPVLSRAQWIATSPRVPVRSEYLHGSIALKGLRFDDLTLARYHDTLAPQSPEVVLFSPGGDENGYFAEFGWTANGSNLQLPGPNTVWTPDGKELTPTHPLILTWRSPDAVTFTVKLTLDEKYLFTITQSAQGAQTANLRSYGYINRVYDMKKHPPLGIMHEGPLGVFDGTLTESGYKKLLEANEQAFESTSGWLGISDKYWLAAIIPPAEAWTARFSHYASKGRDHFQTDYLGQSAPETTLHLFAGAKELAVLDDYGARYQIPLFDRAVDFGSLYFLTKPIFLTLTYFHKLVGNFGIAILLLTVIVKLLMFPLANKSFKSMSQMKTLQPKMTEIRERCKDDKLKMNQEVMELYKREKINPASGCLPIFVQLPVFFALYKVLYVSLEMRHAPFFGWIHDLSAPDPTNLFTLFGLIQWQPPTFLHLGIWPIIMCATMVIQQRQSPPPPDPMQAKMMTFLPFIFLYMFSSFPAGLVIYWCWSNILTILQQAYITKKHGGGKTSKNP